MSLGAFAAGVATYLVALQGAVDGASAQGFAFSLEREYGTERCPDRAALGALVAKRLSVSSGSLPAPVAESVSVSIENYGEGYSATITARGLQGGTRRLVDARSDCKGLAEALPLMLAMIADGQPLPPEAPAARPTTAAPPRPFELGAGVAMSTVLGGATVGYTLDALWHPWPHVLGGVTGLWLPGRDIEKAGGTVRVSALAAWFELCWGVLPFGARVIPTLCGQIGGGMLSGAAKGYLEAQSTTRAWFTAGAMAGVDIRVWRALSLALQAGRLFSLRNQEFTVGGLGPVFEADGGWIAGAGMRVRIP